MSLVITSNIGTENTPAQSNVFKPYSYQNRLLNTMRIPPNSEIALQSAKINKNGLFVLDRTNSGFCQYFGTPVEDLHNDNIENSTTVPFRAVIGAGDAFRAGDVKNEVNIDDMVGEIQKGINEATFHPSLITGATTTSVAVSAKYDSSSEVFEGFKFIATQQVAKTTRNAADIVWTGINKNDDDVTHAFGQAAGKVTSTTQQGFIVQNQEYPLSQNSGEAVFNFSDANTAGGNWMCGFSRINRRRNIGDGDYEYSPNYFTPPAVNNVNLRRGVYVGDQLRYSDVAVVRQGSQLRVYQSCARSQFNSPNYVNEIVYYGGHNANFGTQYNISTNNDAYRKVKYVLKNEELQIFLIKADGTEVLLCDYTTLRAAGAVKNQCLNPLNAAKWALYPVCGVGGTVAAGRGITLESIEHYKDYPKYDATKYFNYDWWGWSQEYNQTVFCRELETRDWNNFSRTTSNHGVAANGLLAPKGVNASGGMADYDSLIITARSNAYGEENTELCNTQATLGFLGDPVSRPSATSNIATTNESSTTPKLIANISLFIRLNNFTQNSMNARQGTLSKIIAHLPRFDNSGNETGGLYFEPHEKTYISLNNPTELLVNSFDIDIVYENETFCTALTGKTIVCLHIRQKK
tara:strand:- start:7868 stop:9766 length:1899 start_codon:yes stop_codon:yes gene_type:complete